MIDAPTPRDTNLLSNVDLNLFLVLDAVLAEGSVTRAARTLSVTQSAVSNALARLRELLGDPLFVRNGRGLVPTPRAQELAPVMRRAMAELRTAVDRADFVPETSPRRFTLCWSDAQTIAHLSDLVPLFAERLPRAMLRIVTVDYLIATNGLATGEVDVAMGPVEAAHPPLLSESIYRDGVLFVVRRGHPKVRGTFRREQFDEVEFIDIELALGKGGVGNRMMTGLLARHGLAWNVGMIVPEFTAAAHAAAASDYVVGLPTRVAHAFSEFLPLELVELPAFLNEPKMNMALMWHPRTETDAGARYFRRVVAEACREASLECASSALGESRPPRTNHGRTSAKTSRD